MYGIGIFFLFRFKQSEMLSTPCLNQSYWNGIIHIQFILQSKEYFSTPCLNQIYWNGMISIRFLLQSKEYFSTPCLNQTIGMVLFLYDFYYNQKSTFRHFHLYLCLCLFLFFVVFPMPFVCPPFLYLYLSFLGLHFHLLSHSSCLNYCPSF